MASRQQRDLDGGSLGRDEGGVTLQPEVFAIREVVESDPVLLACAPPEAVPPTLGEAFAVVRAALEHHFEDNLPVIAECALAQALHSDGNVAVAWRRIVLLLEMAINASLRQ